MPVGAAHAGRERGERREAAVGDRQVLDRLGRDGERSLAARRLNDRRLAFDFDRLGHAADLDRQRADRDAVAGAGDDAAALQRLEAAHRDFDGVGVGGDVRKA